MAFKTHINDATGNQPGQVTTLLTSVLSEGVHDLYRGDFEVTGTAGLAVDVAKGEAFVENDDYVYGSQDQKFYSVASSATEQVVIASNSSGNPRIDIICIEVDPGAVPGVQGVDASAVVVVAGTPAASPVAPAVPDHHLLLAEVEVANGASAISDNEITDRRLQFSADDKGAGWKYAGTYGPAYQAATTIRFTSQDLTWLFEVRDKLRLKQGGAYKYFQVTGVTFSTHTDLTITGLGDYTLDNATITDFYYSKVSTPVDFPRKLDGVWWEELGRTTLTGAGDTITVNNLPARKYLKIYASLQPTGGTINGSIRFNNDSGSNYANRVSDNGGADSTSTSQTSLLQTIGTAAVVMFFLCEIINIATQEKISFNFSMNPGTAGGSNAPNRSEKLGKWANTSAQITRVDLINGGTGDYAIGSEVIVLGHD